MENKLPKINPAPSPQGIKPCGKDNFSIHPCAKSAGYSGRCWIKIIVGLGNPGPEYENTYHNAGHLMVDYLFEEIDRGNSAGEIGFHKFSSSRTFETARSDDLSLVKTLTYMNESGRAVKAALRNLNADVDSLMLVHDDSDLELGGYKFSFGSGSAGHRGVKSAMEALGTKNFWRLRIGIRKSAKNPDTKPLSASARAKALEFVLKKITKKDVGLMRSAFEKSSKELFGKNY